MLRDGFTRRDAGRRTCSRHDQSQAARRKGPALTAITSGALFPTTRLHRWLDYHTRSSGRSTKTGQSRACRGPLPVGNASWEIVRVENGRVRVADAHGKPPSIPFWLGEAPSRTHELSASVSRLRTEIADRFAGDTYPQASGATLAWLTDEVGLSGAAAEQIIEYLIGAKVALGVMPSQDTLVIERFFDEAFSADVIHSPWQQAMRLGVGARKGFCRKLTSSCRHPQPRRNRALSWRHPRFPPMKCSGI